MPWQPISRSDADIDAGIAPFDGKRHLIRTEPGVTGQNVWIAYWSEDHGCFMVSAPGDGWLAEGISHEMEWCEIEAELPSFSERPS